jgi:hypothetical protein
MPASTLPGSSVAMPTPARTAAWIAIKLPLSNAARQRRPQRSSACTVRTRHSHGWRNSTSGSGSRADGSNDGAAAQTSGQVRRLARRLSHQQGIRQHEIELARAVSVTHRIAVGDRHVELELGVHMGKIRERHLQPARRNVLEQSDAPPSPIPAGAAAHMRCLVVEREDPLSEGQKGLAFRRHHHAARAAAQEGAVEDVF